MAALLLAALALSPQSAAQDDGCGGLLCTPSVTFEPSVAVGNAFGGPRVRDLATGEVRELDPDAQVLLVATVAVPTRLPRTSLGLQVLWTPFADTDSNPFTGYSAESLGEGAVAANAPLVEVSLDLALVERAQLGGWAAVGLGVVDQFGPAARPDDDGTYVQRFNLELAATGYPLAGLPEGRPGASFLRDVGVYVLLDYLTGLPDAGDEVPRGGRLYLDDASPWSVIGGVVIPLAPNL